MHIDRRAALALLSPLLAPPALPAVSAPAPAARIPATSRTIAIGDLHGDCDAFKRVLRLAGVIDEYSHQWTGGDAVLVQVGDVLDRGSQEAECLALLRSLKLQAPSAGGQVFTLLGNHEVLNAIGVTTFVSDAGATAFGDSRAEAFRPGGALATEIAEWPVALVVGDTAFVHGGLTPAVVAAGPAAANAAARSWLRGEAAELPPPLLLPTGVGGRSPLWTRDVGVPVPSASACDELGAALGALGVARLVVGHTVQEGGINAACDKRVWRVDVGLSSAMLGAAPQALEIRKNGQVRRLGGGGGGSLMALRGGASSSSYYYSSAIGDLCGATILVTAPPAYARRLQPLLEARGARVVRCPAVTTTLPTGRDAAALRRRLLSRRGALRGEYVAFTSRRGIEAAVRACGARRLRKALDARPSSSSAEQPPWAIALGADAGALVSAGMPPQRVLTPRRASPDGAVALLRARVPRKLRGATTVLCPIPCVAGLSEPAVVPAFLRALRKAGFAVEAFPAYSTRWPGPSRAAARAMRRELARPGGVDAIALTSTAEAEGLLRHARAHGVALPSGADTPVVALGPTTAAGARALGVRVDVVNRRYASFAGLADALAAVVRKRRLGRTLLALWEGEWLLE